MEQSFKELYGTLTEDQKEAIDLLIKGRNIFLTGEAGTGKSYVTRVFSKYCEENKIRIVKCAPTGIAATEIEGSTLHYQFELDLTPMTKEPYTYPEFLDSTDVVLIDEISMCRLDIFEYVMLQIARANNMQDRLVNQKFIQVVLVGDFFQLPPVITEKDRFVLEQWYDNPIGKGFAFQSRLWKDLGFRTINLKTIIRQQDKVFCDNLSKARHGDYSCVRYIEDHSAKSSLNISDSVCLTGKNSTASAINNKGLDLIEGEEFSSKVILEGIIKPGDYPCEDDFRFKIGSRVMSLLNDKDGEYNNGTLGTIKAYNKGLMKITVEFDNGNVCDIQKHTFENYEYSLDKNSSMKRQKELQLLISNLEFARLGAQTAKEIEDINKEIEANQKDLDKLKRSKGDLKKEAIGSATNYPLKLAYAITIHKSQGQTFDKVNIIPEIFDDGQFYVAVSRCKTIENIYFAGTINPNKIKANKEVEEFYKDSDNYTYFDNMYVDVKIKKDIYAELIYSLLIDTTKYQAALKAVNSINTNNARLLKIQQMKAGIKR